MDKKANTHIDMLSPDDKTAEDPVFGMWEDWPRVANGDLNKTVLQMDPRGGIYFVLNRSNACHGDGTIRVWTEYDGSQNGIKDWDVVTIYAYDQTAVMQATLTKEQAASLGYALIHAAKDLGAGD